MYNGNSSQLHYNHKKVFMKSLLQYRHNILPTNFVIKLYLLRDKKLLCLNIKTTSVCHNFFQLEIFNVFIQEMQLPTWIGAPATLGSSGGGIGWPVHRCTWLSPLRLPVFQANRRHAACLEGWEAWMSSCKRCHPISPLSNEWWTSWVASFVGEQPVKRIAILNVTLTSSTGCCAGTFVNSGPSCQEGGTIIALSNSSIGR